MRISNLNQMVAQKLGPGKAAPNPGPPPAFQDAFEQFNRDLESLQTCQSKISPAGGDPRDLFVPKTGSSLRHTADGCVLRVANNLVGTCAQYVYSQSKAQIQVQTSTAGVAGRPARSYKEPAFGRNPDSYKLSPAAPEIPARLATYTLDLKKQTVTDYDLANGLLAGPLQVKPSPFS